MKCSEIQPTEKKYKVMLKRHYSSKAWAEKHRGRGEYWRL